MADIYILDMGDKRDSIRCAFHIPVPATNNFAGISYRTALVQYQEDTTSAVPDLATSDPVAAAGLADGSIYEHVETVTFSATDTNTAKWNAIKAAYTARKAAILTAIQNRLEFWGFSGNE